MYQKNYILLLAANIICTSMLWFSKSYLVRGEEQAQPTVLAKQYQVDMPAVETQGISEQRVIQYEVLRPEYCIAASDEDVEILMRIVEAEAGGEDVTGKLLVANVVINRVKSEAFPDTVREVVYQRSQSVTQFSPVSDGSIGEVTISQETKDAVYRALFGEDVSQGALYFMARKIADPAKASWFDTRLTYLFAHGGHEFYE